MFAKQRKGFEKHKSQKKLFIKIGNISKKQKLSGRLFIKEVKYPKINTDLGMLPPAVLVKGTAGLIYRSFFISLNSF